MDKNQYRSALGSFPTGVAIVTGLDSKGHPMGMTINSFNSVSLDPALVLWSVDHQSRGFQDYSDMEYYAIHILSKKQIAISNRFAQRDRDKYADLSYETNAYGVPILEGCCAIFQCKRWQLYPGGDHTIIVGRVEDFQHNRFLEPLVFSRGSYSQIGIPTANYTAKESIENSTELNNNLLYLLRLLTGHYADGFYKNLAQFRVDIPQWRIYALLHSEEALSVASIVAKSMENHTKVETTLLQLKQKNTP